MSWNARGLNRDIEELEILLNQYKVDIIAIQETLIKGNPSRIRDYIQKKT